MDFFNCLASFSGFALPQSSWDYLICSFPSLTTLFLGWMISPHVLSLHHSWNIWIWEASHNVIVWEQLIQSPLFANKSRKAQRGKGPPWDLTGSQRQGWDFEPQRLPIYCTSQYPSIHPGWEINANQALELWGDCRHFINIQMRETFRPLLSLLSIPFFTGSWLYPLLGAGEGLTC